MMGEAIMANRLIPFRKLAGTVACAATLMAFSTAHSASPKETPGQLQNAEKFVMETSKKAILILQG